MPLILGITPGCDQHPLQTLLDKTGWPTVVNQPDTWYQTGLEQPDESKQYLLIHCRPEQAVATALGEGDSPQQALQAWLIAAQAMVSFYKHHRKQTLMVFQDSLRASPEPLLEVLSERMGQPAAGSSQWEQPEGSAGNALHTLMACQLVRQTSNIEQMLAQLEACTLPLGDPDYQPPQVNIEAVAGHLAGLERQLEQAANDKITSAAAIEELEQNLANLTRQHTEEAERLQNLLREQEASNAQLQEQHQTERQVQQQASDNLRQENTSLLEQLHLVQEELEAKFQQAKDQEQALADLQARSEQTANASATAETRLKTLNGEQKALQSRYQALIKDHKSQQEAFKKERSDLKAAHEDQSNQVEALKKQIKTLEQQHQKAEKELQLNQANLTEENELLLEQLHLVQEELEAQFNNRKGLEAELDEHRHHHDHALQAANSEINRLQTELNAFRSSASWKATAPVRAMAKPFRRAHSEEKSLKKQQELVKKSGLFDEQWYLNSYPDVVEAGMNPIKHYLKFGVVERRNPSPDFDTDWYLSSYPDVVEAELNPLVHYIKFGQQEGRATNRYHHPSLPAPGTA